MCQSHIFFQNNQFIYSSCLRKFFLALIFGESRRTSWFIYLHLPVRILLLAEITLYHFQWALFGAMCINIFLCHGNFTVRAWNQSKRTNPQMWLWRTSPSLYLGKPPMVIQIWKKNTHEDLLTEAKLRFSYISSRSVFSFLMTAPSFSIRISLHYPSIPKVLSCYQRPDNY